MLAHGSSSLSTSLRVKEVLSLNWTDGSLLGCKSHDTTNVTKIVGVINKVPWNSDLNAIDGKVWVIWNNVDIPLTGIRRYST
ncbi:hypothetical protein TNCT_333911 [Trichonephila clavata]|uniref:Uncharacterized protein n=1 Tax=Trichonephila clavata TaxID=2740835 RepID=A0A8X6FME9_TRICU|nr:hypothetical protein TNCT_333911 [Trichonephila clavata]